MHATGGNAARADGPTSAPSGSALAGSLRPCAAPLESAAQRAADGGHVAASTAAESGMLRGAARTATPLRGAHAVVPAAELHQGSVIAPHVADLVGKRASKRADMPEMSAAQPVERPASACDAVQSQVGRPAQTRGFQQPRVERPAHARDSEPTHVEWRSHATVVVPAPGVAEAGLRALADSPVRLLRTEVHANDVSALPLSAHVPDAAAPPHSVDSQGCVSTAPRKEDVADGTADGAAQQVGSDQADEGLGIPAAAPQAMQDAAAAAVDPCPSDAVAAHRSPRCEEALPVAVEDTEYESFLPPGVELGFADSEKSESPEDSPHAGKGAVEVESFLPPGMTLDISSDSS